MSVLLLISSLVFSLISIFLHIKIDFVSSDTITSLATITWLISIFFYGIFCLGIRKKQDIKYIKNDQSSLTQKEKVIFIFILSLGIILRLYKISHKPFGLDEWYWTSTAKNILTGTVKTPFGFFGDSPSNMLSFPIALFMLFFNNVVLASRLPQIIYGVLNVIIVFSFLKDAFNKKVAFFSLLVLSTSIWDINTQIQGYHFQAATPLLVSGSIYFLYRSYKYLSLTDIFICSMFVGVAINLLYVPSLIIISSSIYIVSQLLLKKQKIILIISIIYFLSVLLITTPTMIKVFRQPELTIGRHKDLIMQNYKFSKKNKLSVYYLDQIKLTLDDFKYDQNKFNLYGLWGLTIDQFTSIFFIIGLIISIRFFYKDVYLLLLLNFIIMFIPVVVVYRSASTWREIGFLPTIYIMTSIAVVYVSELFVKIFKKLLKMNIKSSIFYVLVLIYIVVWSNIYRFYYNNQLALDLPHYDTYCKKVIQYFGKNIPLNSMILLPDEYCTDIIKITYSNKYKFEKYYDLSEMSMNKTDNPIYLVKLKESCAPKIIADSDIENYIKNRFKNYVKQSIFFNNLKIVASIYKY